MRFIIALLFLPIAIYSQDLSLTISSQIAPTCSGESDGIIILTADGGVSPYLYAVVGEAEQSTNIFQGLPAGDYEFIVTDADGTTAFASATLEEGINLSININDVDPSCKSASDGQLMISEVNGVSNVTYEISGPTSAINMTGIFTDLPVGSYIVSAATSSDCRIVISTILSSDVDCPDDPDEEDPNLCPLLVNRIGMQINKVSEDEYSLRIQYQEAIDVIKHVDYTALYDIIHFHLYQRQMNISLKPNFKFELYCTDVESMRNGTGNSSYDDESISTSTQKEISLIRSFILNINDGESLKI